MTTSTKQELIKAKFSRWRDVRSGKLVVEPAQLVVYRNKIIGNPERAASFELNALTDVNYEAAGNCLHLVFSAPEGGLADEIFSFRGREQTDAAKVILGGLSEKLEDRKQREKEEAARLENERQERLKQVREIFAGEMWEISETLWAILKADYSMVQAVIAADGNESRQQYSNIWQQAERLKKICQIDLTAVLRDLDEAVSTQDGPEIIKKASNILRQLSDQVLHPEITWAKWQDHKEMLARVLPNHDHLPYFLIFGNGYFEALLAARIGDWTGVNSVMPLLRSSSAILHWCFGFDLDRSLEATNSAATERNVDKFAESVLQVESAVTVSFKPRPFKFEMTAPVPKG